jgi:capsular polysaccharide biosynthesis protein
MQLRAVIRREKWRLRSLKRFVLPTRNIKRRLLAIYRALTRRPLLQVEKSAIEYLATPGRGSAIQVFPAEPVEILPHPFENQRGAVEVSHPAYVFNLPDVDFWGHYGGSVVTKDNRLLADLSPEVWGIDNHAIFSTFRLPKPTVLRGHSAICVTPEATGNYYHWIVDLMPRLALLKKVAGGFGDFGQILINGSSAPYEKASITQIGAPLDKLRYVDGQCRFQIEKATIPSMDHSSKIVAPWKIRVLREMGDAAGVADHQTPARVYISRKRAAVRRILNEAEFTPLLQKNGFMLVELESVSWGEQIKLFSNADVVLAPHGAALANIVFCRPKTLVAEIGTRSGYLEFYWSLASSAALDYQFLEARPRVEPGADSRRAVENEDMIVDRKALAEFLGRL